MSWHKVIGQERAKTILSQALERKQVAHAYLFHGQEGIGKDALAMAFAQVLVCERQGSNACNECASCRKASALQHPNIVFVCSLPTGKNEKAGDDPIATFTEEQLSIVQEQLKSKAADPYHRIQIPKATSIKVNSIRQIRRGSMLTSAERGSKVYIISNAEEMTPEASNSLLKTLEEPSENTILLLTTSQKDLLLPTILSRCQLLQCDPLSEEEIASALVAREATVVAQARLAARLSDGSYRKAVELLSVDILQERQSVVQFIRLALGSQKIQLIAMMDELARTLDRDGAKRWLRLMHVWMRDALLLHEGEERGVHNQDQLKELKSYVEKFPNADLIGAVESIERSIALIDKNVYLVLVFSTLAIDLHKYSYAESLFSHP